MEGRIPKDNGKTRPLSIYCYEDKLVQEAIKRVVEVMLKAGVVKDMSGYELTECEVPCTVKKV